MKKFTDNTYILSLLLEALCSFYSLEELMETFLMERTLTKRFGVSPEDAKALVEGARMLKELRSKQGFDNFVIH